VVDRTDAEGCATASAIAVLIEPFGGFLDAERTGTAITLQVESEDQADEFCLDRIDFETLLDLRAATLGLDDAIAKRRRRAVPESLPCGFAHRADDIFAVLPRGVLVENTNDLTHQFLRRIAGRLSDRHHIDAMLAQVADGELHLRTIAIEAREGMNADHIEAALRARGLINHALEGGSSVIGRRRSWLDKLLGDDPALGIAKPLGQFPLGRNGDVAGCLASRAHAKIERSSPRSDQIRLRGRTECHGGICSCEPRIAGAEQRVLSFGLAQWNAERPSFAFGAKEKIVESDTKQTDDGIELLIPDDHIAGKIAFDRKCWALPILARSMRPSLGKLEHPRSRA